jgi:uncharacterized membrane protein YbhN (UPF0104 family)
MYDNIEKYYPGLLFFAKILILILAYKLISERIFEERSYLFFIENLQQIKFLAIPVAIFLLALTMLNWYVEVLKWKSLSSSIRQVSFSEALKQSLSSLTVSLITPNRIGEYGAKALYFDRADRGRVVLYNFIGNFSQMSITVLFGLLGLWAINEQIRGLEFISLSWNWILLFAACSVGAGFLLRSYGKVFYLKIQTMLQKIPRSLILNVWSLSMLKYLVFSHQFYFLLFFFGVELDYTLCMSLIGISYLVSSLIPGFVLFDWLVKGSVAVLIFSRFGVDEILVLSITSVMWLLNFGLPSLVGSLYVITFNRPRLAVEKSKTRA